MEIETTLKLTDALRAAAMCQAQEVLGEVPEVLSGHDDDGTPSSAKPHAAYISLPFVSENQIHADGRILGLAVALPRWLPTVERRRIVRALARVDYLAVRGVGRFELERVRPDQAVQYNLRPDTWLGPGRRWASVTPVILDRFPKRNKGVESLLAQSCEFIGLPRPVEVVADRGSPLHGVEPSSRYCVRRTGEPTPRLFTHVTLTFAQQVRGPLLLGASRHFGLGLFRPLQEAGNDPECFPPILRGGPRLRAISLADTASTTGCRPWVA
jgi:CRISPR-associated protein Csb2